MSRRPKAAFIHFALSATIGLLAAGVVFELWYPAPYATISGGLALFVILVSVDVVLGPTLTAVVAAPTKPTRELRRDLAVIVALQVAAFGYGLYTIALARPVYLAFEVDRFRVVTAVDIDPDSLGQAPQPLRRLPWTGPRVIAAVKPVDPAEQMRSIELGMAGFDLSMLPANWREFGPHAAEAWARAKPLQALLDHHPDQRAAALAIASAAGSDPQALRFLPVVSRRASWCAVVAAPNAHIVGFLPVDGF